VIGVVVVTADAAAVEGQLDSFKAFLLFHFCGLLLKLLMRNPRFSSV